jgi:putative membrane protein
VLCRTTAPFGKIQFMLARLLLSWFISALALWIVARLVPGIYVAGFGTALVATLVIAVVNATVGLVLAIITLPLTILTLGLFLFVLNAFLLKLASLVVPGFGVRGIVSALVGSVVLTVLTALLRYLVF